jgi:hypothetical protein
VNRESYNPDPKGRLPLWWMAWLLSTVGTPVLALALVLRSIDWGLDPASVVVPLIPGLLLHLISSHKIEERGSMRPGSSVGLVMGGWFLMATIFFGGCWEKITTSL